MSDPPVAPGSVGVPGSSALTFLRHSRQQSAAPGSAAPGGVLAPEALVPAGVQALLDACSAVYPNQPNPLQVTTRLKYWLGGQDPLDYISMYWNPGNEELGVPSHWHYISFGLSDLHGDGRVHPLPAARSASPLPRSASPMARSASPLPTTASPPATSASPSGKGIELTFRLVASSPENAPLWPAAMMQALARYIHATGNSIQAGDHIGGVSLGNLKLRHLLVARDPQLGAITTSHGAVTFTQLVACTGRELAAAQRGDPHRVLAALATHPTNGCSPYLVSMQSRGSVTSRSVTSPSRHVAALAAVTAPYILLSSQSMEPSVPGPGPGPGGPLVRVARQTNDVTGAACVSMESLRIEEDMRMTTDSFVMSSIERALPHIDTLNEGAGSVRYLPGAHLVFSRQAAAMLPLAIDGRVRCGSHFTWSWSSRHVTLVGRHVTHALCRDAPRHLALHQHWLQIYIPDQLAEDMSTKFANFSQLEDSESETETDAPCDVSDRDNIQSVSDKCGKERSSRKSEGDGRMSLPCSFNWPEYNLTVSVVDDLYPKDFVML